MFAWFKSLFRKPPQSLPQLKMRRDNLDNLPEIMVPEGYVVRTYQPGDEAAWCDIMEGNVSSNWTVEKCREKMIEDPRFQPDNLFFITHNDQPVASACAWSDDPENKIIGVVHMVAALESHRGHGLGTLLNAVVLNRLKELGYQQVTLNTDDWRLPAVKSYLTAGFRPEPIHESHPQRWENILEQLDIAK